MEVYCRYRGVFICSEMVPYTLKVHLPDLQLCMRQSLLQSSPLHEAGLLVRYAQSMGLSL